jgi:hypothetical protein
LTISRVNAAALALGAPGTRGVLEGTTTFVPADFDIRGQFNTPEERETVQSIFDFAELGTALFSDTGEVLNIQELNFRDLTNPRVVPQPGTTPGRDGNIKPDPATGGGVSIPPTAGTLPPPPTIPKRRKGFTP